MKNRVILINSQSKKNVLSRKKSFCFSLPLGQWNGIKRKGPERQEGDNGTHVEHHFCPQRGLAPLFDVCNYRLSESLVFTWGSSLHSRDHSWNPQV